MVSASFREFTAAVDKAYQGPRDQPLRLDAVVASLADGLVRGIHPLEDLAAAHVTPIIPQPSNSLTPTPG